MNTGVKISHNMEEPFLEKIIQSEISGKNAAINSYDKMMWTVRSGFLTLVFAAWGLIIKSALEVKSEMASIQLSRYIL